MSVQTSGAHGLISMSIGVFTLAMALGALSLPVRGQQIYVAYGSGLIGEYNPDGTPVNTSLITGLSEPYGLAISGTNIFAANMGYEVVGEYTTSGATVNASLIKLFGPYYSLSLAVSGTNLFVGSGMGGGGPGFIGEYTTCGATNNASLITGLKYPVGLAISGSNIFVADETMEVIGEYTMSGATVNPSLIAFRGPGGIAISGTNIFVADYWSGVIREYTTSGATVNASLITGLNYPVGVAISGNQLFVLSGAWVVGEYTTSGATINASLITGSGQPYSMAVVLEPGIVSISLAGTNLVLNGSNGISGQTCFVLKNTNLTQPLSRWQPVATNVVNSNGNFTITATNAVDTTASECFYILKMQ